MPKIKNKRRFSRKRDQRRALLIALARALILNEKIKTTEAKAKELRPFVEKLITRGKEESVHGRRVLAARLQEDVAKKLVKEIAPRYRERAGGYTRILKLGPRLEDGAKMVIIELV